MHVCARVCAGTHAHEQDFIVEGPWVCCPLAGLGLREIILSPYCMVQAEGGAAFNLSSPGNFGFSLCFIMSLLALANSFFDFNISLFSNEMQLVTLVTNNPSQNLCIKVQLVNNISPSLSNILL